MPHRSGKLIATLMLAGGVLASGALATAVPVSAAPQPGDPSIDSLAGAFLAARVAEPTTISAAPSTIIRARFPSIPKTSRCSRA
jgi:hypothetical protein